MFRRKPFVCFYSSSLPSTSTHCIHSFPKSNTLPQSFDPKFVERGWREHWLAQAGKYVIQNHEEPFCMVLPPPNVTGKLHLGHALTLTIEDALVRWKRIHGLKTSWQPGTDHAGIATQVIVEKKLWNERKIRRLDMTREEFLDECHKWKLARQNDIRDQMQRFGVLLNWPNQYFTLDENFTKAVNTAFVRLHQDGLIVRDTQLVYWCPTLQSTLSDAEVDAVQVPVVDGSARYTVSIPNRSRSVEVGVMYEIDYLLDIPVGTIDRITIATTRPETIPGDVAIAVNPKDNRYINLIGRAARHPFYQDRMLPIIADEAVEINKGTGVVKVTPAHDYRDYEIGLRNDLPMTDYIFDDQGKIAKGTLANLDGLDRFAARQMVAKMLSARSVPPQEEVTIKISSRTGDIVEPKPMRQWFLKCKQMGENTLKAIENGRLKIRPQYFEATWHQWVSKSDVWCLSRQLWWGHRIPAWKNTKSKNWHVATSLQELIQDTGGIESDFVQDIDVLDTWFSAALVPMVTAGWPTKFDERLYPLDLMQTGHDILGFWVVRQTMLCQHLMNGELPFPRVLMHGMIRDMEGRKMSKSLGNVIDPLDVIDGCSLKELQTRVSEATALDKTEKEKSMKHLATIYPNGMEPIGVDALRFGLLLHPTLSSSINIDPNQLATAHRFCNKIWNAFLYSTKLWSAHDQRCQCRASFDTRSSRSRIKDAFEDTELTPLAALSSRWILSRLAAVCGTIADKMHSYGIQTVAQPYYEFAMHHIFPVYLETTKTALADDAPLADLHLHALIMAHVLNIYLLHLSIAMPYLAAEIRARLPENLLHVVDMGDHLPEWLGECDFNLEAAMSNALKVLNAARSIRILYDLPLTEELTASLITEDDILFQQVKKCKPVLDHLGRFNVIDRHFDLTEFSTAPVLVGQIDGLPNALLAVHAKMSSNGYQRLLNRLNSKLAKKEKSAELIEQRLSQEFTTKQNGSEKHEEKRIKRFEMQKENWNKSKLKLDQEITELKTLIKSISKL